MNIGFYVLFATSGASDNERYLRYVIKALANDYPEHKLYVYTTKLTKKTSLALIDELHNAEYRLPAASGFHGSMWRSFGVTNCLRPDKIDIFHGLHAVLPLNIAAAHVPTVVTLHEPDFNAVENSNMSWWQRTLALHRVGAAVRAATRIIVFSEDTRMQLKERYDVEPTKVELVDTVEKVSDQLMRIYHTAIEVYNQQNK